MAHGPDELWRVPHGVKIRPACQCCRCSEPWSGLDVVAVAPLPCQETGGLDVWGATGEEKGATE